jgi:hypothetical protein
MEISRNCTITCSPGRASRALGNRGAHFVRALFQGAKRASEQGTSPDGSAVKPTGLPSAPQVSAAIGPWGVHGYIHRFFGRRLSTNK